MPCNCNAICDNDCSSNQLCTGHVPACSNSYGFVSVIAGDIVLASHLAQLETAIDAERVNGARRYVSGEPAYCSTHTPGNIACTINAFSAYGFSGSRSAQDPILAAHWNGVKSANNIVTSNSGYGGTVSANFVAEGIILGVDITQLQTQINYTRNVCICDSHCNCDPTDCGCNGECPSDDYYYYYP